MKIKLIDLGGEFCTSRKSSAILKIQNEIEKCLKTNEPLVIAREGVKILTPSFIDELLPPLLLKHGKDRIETLVKFDPPLDGFLAEQVKRGFAARVSNKQNG